MTAASIPSSGSRPLAGTTLLLARIVWLVLVTFQWASCIYEIPHFLPLAEHPCQQDCLLTIQQAQSLTQAGIPLTGFLVIVLIASVLAVLVSTTVAIILFVRRSQDLTALLAAYVIVTLPTSVTLMYGPTVTNLLQTTAFNLPPTLDLLINAIQSCVSIGLFLLFPSGHFVPLWSSILLVGFVVFTTVFVLWPSLQAPLTPGWLLFFGTAAGCIAYRYWRVSIPVEHQQTKWVSLGFVTFMVIISAHWIPLSTTLSTTLYEPLAYLAYQLILPVVPLSFFTAIQRYRLYDIDTIIRRTLVYGLLTAILLAIYAIGVVGVQTLVGGIAGPSAQLEPILIVVTTLMIAALFQPLRRFLQESIDQRFYRTKYDVERTLTTFGTTLHSDVDLDHLSSHLVNVVEETMRPEFMSLWLRAALLASVPSVQEISG